MAKVLFITEKYHTPPHLPTNNMHNLIGSWKCAGYGDYEHLFIDPEPGCIWSTKQIDEALMDKEYDAFVISVYHHLPSREVAQKIGHKGCMIWWDSIVSMGGVFSWADCINQICVDHGKGVEYPQYPRVHCMEVPQDTSIFYPDPNIEKDIDISFVGSTSAPWPERKIIIDKIRNAGINIWAGGGKGNNPEDRNLRIEEYARIHKRSKICLNLAHGHGGKTQRKGRVFEISGCGGCMMSQHPEMFRGREGEFFTDGVDYFSFHEGNMIDQIYYHLEREDIRKMMQENIYKKYIENYSPKCFWKKILNICGVSV